MSFSWTGRLLFSGEEGKGGQAWNRQCGRLLFSVSQHHAQLFQKKPASLSVVYMNNK